MDTRQHVSRGLVAGLAAAAAFAVWFLLVDVVQGQPLRTPAYMSGLLFSFTTALPATARVIAFTLVHFLAFALVGIAMSMALAALDTTPGITLGAVVGFLLFDIVFYASVLFVGVNVVRELGWPQVLSANILAGVVMLGYLRVRAGLPLLDARGFFDDSPVIRRGIVAGVIGAAIVALWFFAIDAVQQRIFYTPAALGSALFWGVSDPNEVSIGAPVVIGYTLLHVGAFVLAGLAAARLMAEAEAHPSALIGVALFFVTLEVLSLGILSAVATWLFQTVAWWSPIVANLLAAAGMAGYLWRAHPGVRYSVKHEFAG